MNRFVIAILLVASGCNPADGVESFVFALAPGASVVLPTADELGSPIRAFDYARAEGRVSANLKMKSVDVSVDGLPPVATPGGPYYHFVFEMADEPIAPQSLQVAHSPDEGAVEIDLGRLDPDALGRAKFNVLNGPADLRYVHGGRVDLVIVAADATVKSFAVLEGEVGNLADAVPQAAAAPTGHHH